MDGVAYLIRLYWPQVVGVALTFFGVELLQGPAVIVDHSLLTFGMMLCSIGWMSSVFNFFTWPSPTSTETKPRIRVFWAGLCAFLIAAIISITLYVLARGWTEQTGVVCIAIALIVLGTAVKGVWDRRNDKKV